MKAEKKKNIIIVGILLLLIIGILGVSYAVFNYTGRGERVNTITTGAISMSYEETDNIITIDGALPTTDATGTKRLKEGEYFDFTISSEITGNTNINYEISAKEVGEGTIDGSNIKLYLTKLTDDNSEEELMEPEVYNEETSENEWTGRPSNEMSLYASSMSSSESNRYRLRMYVDENYNPQGDGGGLTFSVRINVYGKSGDKMTIYNNPNPPELDDSMIPVIYDGTNWIKSNTSNGSWYNYDELKWANAVTVSNNTRSNYLSADVGTIVNMDDIETMWVWIPRYSYTIGSEDGTNYYGKQGEYLSTTPTQELPGEIDIKFVSKNVKDRGSAKYIVSERINEDSWYTPDAFTFGEQELSGIWVGKFETSSSNPSVSSGGGNTTSLDPMIKPNVISWRNINVSNAFNVALKMNDSGNRYGFTSNVDTHMMKSSEWGVVSYLSQSKYGKIGNENFSGANKEVYQNRSNSYITGCSYGVISNSNTNYGCQYQYNIDINGTGASTTGNIYGIYDMSGGAWEYVMANYNNISGSSGFSNPLTLDSKYYNLYTSNDINKACDGGECIGHSLSETSGWYRDYYNMISSLHPWLLRGGGYNNANTSAGVFYLYDTSILGGPGDNNSFRLVMSPSL